MNEKRQPRLLGFAGHRKVPDPEALRIAIRGELLKMKELLGEGMTGISSAAAGADLLFLRSCIELRIPTIVILPFHEKRFSEDFEDAEEWALAEKLMGVSLARYVTPGGHGAPEAYRSVSRDLIDWADAFLFAWDGKPPRGVGGTGETVGEARDLGIPARVIDAVSLEVSWAVPFDFRQKARHGFGSRKELLDFLDLRFPNAAS